MSDLDSDLDSGSDDEEHDLPNFAGNQMAKQLSVHHTCDFYVDEAGDCWVVHPDHEPEAHDIDWLDKYDVRRILDEMDS